MKRWLSARISPRTLTGMADGSTATPPWLVKLLWGALATIIVSAVNFLVVHEYHQNSAIQKLTELQVRQIATTRAWIVKRGDDPDAFEAIVRDQLDDADRLVTP